MMLHTRHSPIRSNGRPPLTASQPPPARVPSATVFVGRAVLIAIAIVLAIALLATAARWVGVHAGLVLLTAGLGTVFLVRRTPRRGGPGSQHDRRSPSAHGSPLMDVHPRSRTLVSVSQRSWRAVLAAASTTLLLAAFVVPEAMGVVLVAIGLAGLLAVRVSIM